MALGGGRVITTSLSAVDFRVENEIQAQAETIITAARLGDGRITGGGRVTGRKEGRHMRSRKGNRLVTSCMQMVAAGREDAGKNVQARARWTWDAVLSRLKFWAGNQAAANNVTWQTTAVRGQSGYILGSTVEPQMTSKRLQYILL